MCGRRCERHHLPYNTKVSTGASEKYNQDKRCKSEEREKRSYTNKADESTNTKGSLLRFSSFFLSLYISLPTHILFLFPFSLFLSFPCVYRTTAIHLTLTAPQATPNSQLRPNFCLSKGLKRSQPRDLGGKTRTN